ncbi:MAG: phage tail length tape measure family protein [Brevundimonas sp.]|uniref:phage tail length tape measure family protein n=1 Tax=Brevundimonas sp. TaxID=1871086 RepID=UPI00391BAF51
MTSAVIGALRVTLGLNSAQFTSGLTAAQQQLQATSARFSSVGKKMAGIGAGLSVAITAPFIAFAVSSSKAAQEAADAMGQVEAALTSMGGVSGRTKDQLAGMAEGLMRNSLYDDDEILRKVTANLLTFGNVAGTQFDRAQQAAVDLATRMGGDLQGATLMIGKALNDPIKGLSALGRAGIQFTDAQKAQIKAMVAAGNAAGAQSIMLGELEKQFGGAAAAAQATDPYDKLRDSLGSLQESFGAIVNNYLAPFLDKIASLADRFNGLSPAMQNFIVIGAAIAAAVGPILVAFGSVLTAVGAIGAAFGAGGALAMIVPFLGPIAIAVAAVAAAFWMFRDDIIPVLQAFGAAIQEHVGPKLAPLFEAVKGMVVQLGAAFSAFFSSDSGSASKNLMDFGRIIAQVFGAAVDLITGAINVITQIMRALGALLTGDWSTMWNALGSAVAAMTHGVLNAFRTLFPGVIESMGKLVTGVREWLTNKLNSVFGGVIGKVKEVGDAFFRLYDRVVGHSYVPDMVEETGQWFARLQGLMVDPATAATQTTAERFKTLRDDVRGIMQDLMTDIERAELQFQARMATITAARRAPGADQNLLTELERRARAERNEANVEVLTPIARREITELEIPPVLLRFAEYQKKLAEEMAETIANSRADFADAFSYGIEAAMNDDWTSVLQTIVEQIFGGTLQDALRNLGGSIFDKMGGGAGGKGFDFGSIAKGLGSLFGKIPGFATGGSFRVGGSGGADSKLVSMRLTPGEMVDVRRPGQLQAANNNAPIHFDMRGAVMTADLMAQAERMAAQSGGNALRTARVAVPADRAKSDRYNLKRR